MGTAEVVIQMNEYIPTTEEAIEIWAMPIPKESSPYYEEAVEQFYRWQAKYRESVINEVEDHLVRRDQFTERTLTVIDELREKNE